MPNIAANQGWMVSFSMVVLSQSKWFTNEKRMEDIPQIPNLDKSKMAATTDELNI